MDRALADRERGLGALGVEAEADALASLAQLASGDARTALNLLELAAAEAVGAGRAGGRARARAAAGADRRRHRRQGGPAQGSALRQGGRGALQPHLGAPQVGARERPRRGPLLAGAHARRRRGPALPRPPAGADGQRGHRPRRPGRGGPDAGRLGRLPPAGYAGGRAGAGPGDALPGPGAEVGRPPTGPTARPGPPSRSVPPIRCRWRSATPPPG